MISIEKDLKDLEKCLNPLELDYSAVDLDALREMRKQTTVKYVNEKINLDENITLGYRLLEDIDNLPLEAREEAAKWLETGAKDDSLKPKSDDGKKALELFPGLMSKRGELVHIKKMAQFYLSLIKRYDDIIKEKEGWNENST